MERDQVATGPGKGEITISNDAIGTSAGTTLDAPRRNSGPGTKG